MSRRPRKATQRQLIIDRMEKAFQSLYHNATINAYRILPDDAEEYLSSESQWEILQEHFSWELSEINDTRGHDHDYIEQYIARDYGKVYCYGRCGATCAPSAWVSIHGGSSFSIDVPDSSDLSRFAILRRALDCERWNACVKAACSKESIYDILFNVYEDAKAEALEVLKLKVEALITI
jgi:hypothetical protein